MAFFYLALTLGYMGGIHWLSSLPGDGDSVQTGLAGVIVLTPPVLQNLLHVPLFGLLAWLWYLTLEAWKVRDGFAIILTFLLAAGFGVFEEWHQLHVPGRYASLTDIALNIAGVILAVCWFHRRQRRTTNTETGTPPVR